jgi:hypothetical protein
MNEFFDHHPPGKPAPDRWKEVVPHLKMDGRPRAGRP